MFEVYYRQYDGNDKLLASCTDFYTADQVVCYFLKEHNIKSRYSRMWVSAPGILKIDIGIPNEFFIIKGPVEEVLSKIIVEEE